MQGTLARAWEENNSSFIWGLLDLQGRDYSCTGSQRQSCFLSLTRASLGFSAEQACWGVGGWWWLGFLVLPVHPRDSLRQLSSTPDQPCGNPVFRARELTVPSRPGPEATSSRKTFCTQPLVTVTRAHDTTGPARYISILLRCFLPHIS